MLKTLLFFIILFSWSGGISFSQELAVNVEINSKRIENTNINFLANFEEKIETYLNGYDWTKDRFRPFESIKAEIQIFLTNVSDDYTFTADLVIRSFRPIYNTTRHTTLFLYNDDNWTFRYLPNQAFIHNELQFNAITTLLNFYAYLILGYDYDSFEALGGTPFFVEAQEQVSIAQTGSSPGWQQSSNANNRVQLISDLTNPNYELFRKAFYRYHRLGLDLFIKNPKKARQNILEALQMIQRNKQQTVNNLLFDIFFNAKYLELVAIFNDASPQMRSKAYALLSEIDVSHLNTYRQLQ